MEFFNNKIKYEIRFEFFSRKIDRIDGIEEIIVGYLSHAIFEMIDEIIRFRNGRCRVSSRGPANGKTNRSVMRQDFKQTRGASARSSTLDTQRAAVVSAVLKSARVCSVSKTTSRPRIYPRRGV